MMNVIKIGCEVFLIKNGAVLLGRRKNCSGAETWGLPGGHLEFGETILECAKRELKEELGIEGLQLTLISVVDAIDEGGQYVHMSFLLEQFLGEIRCMEPDLCYEWKFFELDKLPQDVFKPHQKIFENYFKNTIYFEKE